MAVTWALSARPLPVTAALTSLGVWSTTGSPRRAAATIATPLAWAVPITVETLFWLKTRSTATTSGAYVSIASESARSIASSRCATSSPAGVRITSTATARSGRPTLPSTTPTPQRVSPGSTPRTRIPPAVTGGLGASSPANTCSTP